MTYSYKYADLHFHSTASDGILKPKQLAEMLNQMKVHVAALTDHDTIDGFAVFQENFKGLAIPGVELSVQFDNEDVHLLGYGFNPADQLFIDRLRYYQDIRRDRIWKTCAKLNDLGFDIQPEDVLAAAPNPSALGRPHIAKVMVAKGMVPTTELAFKRYLASHKPAYVPKAKMSLPEGIELIHKAQGIAVLAHPGIYRSEQTWRKALNYSPDGVEVHYSQHNQILIDTLLKEADIRKLAISGGSDYHGDWEGKDKLGEYGLNLQEWIRFKEYLYHKGTYIVSII